MYHLSHCLGLTFKLHRRPSSHLSMNRPLQGLVALLQLLLSATTSLRPSQSLLAPIVHLLYYFLPDPDFGDQKDKGL